MVHDAAADPDTDTSDNFEEYTRGTDPCDPDTDNDAVLDGAETDTGVWVSSADTGTDPFVSDTDDDFLADGVETNTGVYVSPLDTGSNPLLRDTDAGGATDHFEVVQGTDLFNPADDPPLLTGDADADGCSNGEEMGTNPQKGGRRDPTNVWDWFDVTGDAYIDRPHAARSDQGVAPRRGERRRRSHRRLEQPAHVRPRLHRPAVSGAGTCNATPQRPGPRRPEGKMERRS
jgi:hypothetical protein